MTFDKRQLAREIELDRRKLAAERLSQLGGQLKAARRQRRDSIERIRLQCRAARQRLRENCEARKEHARADGETVIQARRRAILEERELDRLHRSPLRPRSTSKTRGRTARNEHEAESDDEVRRNLPPELVTVFNRVRRSIKSSPKKSRSEAFLQWAEENPDEIYSIHAKNAERELKQLVKTYEREAAEHSRDRVPF